MGLLEVPLVRRIRRNHAIEHATIHLLARRYPDLHLAGRSDGSGFFLYGKVESEHVWSAAEEGIRRLESQPELAVHPLCGTNMVVGGFIAGLMSMVAVATLSGKERPPKPLQVLPRLILAGMGAMVASQPLGFAVQRNLTTLPEPEGIRVTGVRRLGSDRHVVHRVLLEHTSC